MGRPGEREPLAALAPAPHMQVGAVQVRSRKSEGKHTSMTTEQVNRIETVTERGTMKCVGSKE